MRIIMIIIMAMTVAQAASDLRDRGNWILTHWALEDGDIVTAFMGDIITVTKNHVIMSTRGGAVTVSTIEAALEKETLKYYYLSCGHNLTVSRDSRWYLDTNVPKGSVVLAVASGSEDGTLLKVGYYIKLKRSTK